MTGNDTGFQLIRCFRNDKADGTETPRPVKARPRANAKPACWSGPPSCQVQGIVGSEGKKREEVERWKRGESCPSPRVGTKSSPLQTESLRRLRCSSSSSSTRSSDTSAPDATAATGTLMAENGRAKRLKSSQEGDLSRLDSDLITQVASFVGTSRELLDLALTCKSFGWQQPGSALNWSLAEEVARQAVCSAQHDIEGVRITLPQYARGRTTWLSILHESEDPLKFDTLLGRGMEHENSRRNAVRASNVAGSSGTAIASNYVMVSGIHYAEYLVSRHSLIGVVRPVPNLDPARFSNE
ncbi:hypothetical protein THAOC_33325, partial [Thalassiosira oceanica]